MLERIDRLAAASGQKRRNRSHVIREAVRDYVSRVEQHAEEEREAAVVRRHSGKLALQARALVRQQAKP